MESGRATQVFTLCGLALALAILLGWLALRTQPTPGDMFEIEAARAATVAVEDTPVLAAPDESAGEARTSASEPSAPTVPGTPATTTDMFGGTGRIVGRVRIGSRPVSEATLANVEYRRFAPTPRAGASLGVQFAQNPDDSSVNAASDFSSSELALGRWSVTCKAARTLPGTQEVELTEAGQVVRCDFDLLPTQYFRLWLVVAGGGNLAQATDPKTGTRIDALRIVVSAAELPRAGERFDGHGLLAFKSRHVADEADGAWAQVDTESGTAVWCGVVLGDVVQASQFVPIDQHTVALALSLTELHAAQCSLVLRVDDTRDSKTIAGARFTLTWPSGNAVNGVSDVSGMLAARDLLPAEIEVRIEAAGYVRSDSRVKLEPGIENAVSVHLQPEVSIAGSVRDSAGQPRRGNVWIRPSDGRRKEAAEIRMIPVGPDGAFFIDGLAPESYLVSALSFAEMGLGTDISRVLRKVDCTAGPVAGVVLVTQP